MIGINGLLDGYYFWWCPIFPKWEWLITGGVFEFQESTLFGSQEPSKKETKKKRIHKPRVFLKKKTMSSHVFSIISLGSHQKPRGIGHHHWILDPDIRCWRGHLYLAILHLRVLPNQLFLHLARRQEKRASKVTMIRHIEYTYFLCR